MKKKLKGIIDKEYRSEQNPEKLSKYPVPQWASSRLERYPDGTIKVL